MASLIIRQGLVNSGKKTLEYQYFNKIRRMSVSAQTAASVGGVLEGSGQQRRTRPTQGELVELALDKIAPGKGLVDIGVNLTDRSFDKVMFCGLSLFICSYDKHSLFYPLLPPTILFFPLIKLAIHLAG